MRSTSVLSLCISRSPGRWGWLLFGALLSGGAGCPPAPTPDPTPEVQPLPPPRPPVTQTAPLGPGQDFPNQRVIVVHQADLFGQFEGKQGQTINIRALLMMSKTQPAVGNKGVLFVAPGGGTGATEWVQLGDVEVKQPLDGDSRMQVKIADDEKKFVMPGKKPGPLPKNARLRLRWQW